MVQRPDCVELANSVHSYDTNYLGFVEVPYEFVRMLQMTRGLQVEHFIDGPMLNVVGTDIFLRVQPKHLNHN